jgi:predicted heme/steroid binding protein
LENKKEYTKEELALRNGKTMPDVWVAYKGLIYDVTRSELFEDGEHYFHSSGCDLTEEMEGAPHLDDVMDEFIVVGKLIE